MISMNDSKSYPDIALLDGDILAYRAAHWGDSEGIDDLEDRLRYDIKSWTPPDIKKVVLCFSCPRSRNFRRNFWPEYKAHRDKLHAPDCFTYTLEILYNHSSIKCIDKLEADDLMGMGASLNKAVAVTIDKDLKSVPGWHWNPFKEDYPQYITEEEADRFFYHQWMSGDHTDNIPGLWKVGPKKAEKFLDSVDRKDWDKEILQLYEDECRPEHKEVGMQPKEYSLAMARCVRILRYHEYDKKTNSITLWNPIIG